MADKASITPFTPPAICTTAWFGTLAGDTGPGLRRGVGCVAGTLTWNPDCYPTTAPVGSGCPVGYATAYKSSMSAICCPSGYSHDGRTTGQTDCSSAFKTNAYVGLACRAGAAAVTTSATVSGYTPDVFASPVIIKFPFTSPYSSSKPSTLSSSYSSSTSATRSPTPAPPTSNSGISKGAIAGIVLGALVGLGLVIGAVLFFLHRRKRKQKALLPVPMQQQPTYQQNPSTAPDTTYQGYKAELAAASPVVGQNGMMSPPAHIPPPTELAAEQMAEPNRYHAWTAPTDQQHPYGAQGFAHGQPGYARDPRSTSPFANAQYAGAPEAQSLLQHQAYAGPQPGQHTRPAELG